ncbi:hypothetical protein CPB83DRAFT_734904, partial [Crepidotus variabilis]
PPITFTYEGQIMSGVRMFELSMFSAEVSASVSGPKDEVLQQCKGKKIIFHILWPGYEEHLESPIDVDSAGSLTRLQLGKIIAERYSRFMATHIYAPCSNPEWKFGPLPANIKFKQLYLISLKNIYANAWQAEVAVD